MSERNPIKPQRNWSGTKRDFMALSVGAVTALVASFALSRFEVQSVEEDGQSREAVLLDTIRLIQETGDLEELIRERPNNEEVYQLVDSYDLIGSVAARLSEEDNPRYQQFCTESLRESNPNRGIHIPAYWTKIIGLADKHRIRGRESAMRAEDLAVLLSRKTAFFSSYRAAPVGEIEWICENYAWSYGLAHELFSNSRLGDVFGEEPMNGYLNAYKSYLNVRLDYLIGLCQKKLRGLTTAKNLQIITQADRFISHWYDEVQDIMPPSVSKIVALKTNPF